MIKYLIRQCPECKATIRVEYDSTKKRILLVEGAIQPSVERRTHNSFVSQRVVCCITRWEKMSGIQTCWKAMLIKNFKEINL